MIKEAMKLRANCEREDFVEKCSLEYLNDFIFKVL